MYNTEFTGLIKSVSAGLKAKKLEDGTKIKIGIYRVKLISDSIDYESLAEFNSSISATLLNIAPIPFKSINFGNQTVYNMNLNFTSEANEDEDTIKQSFAHVNIKNLSVTIKDDLPTYIFDLEIPMISEAKFLFTHLKTMISFEFVKQTTTII